MLDLIMPSDVALEKWMDHIQQSNILRNARIRYDYILIDPDPDRNIHRMKGPDGEDVDIEIKNIYMEMGMWQKNKRYNSTSGRIVALPGYISKHFKFNVDHLQVGDRVYFHFNAIDNSRDAGLGIVDEHGYRYIMIHVGILFLAVRKNKIMMISDNILVQPVKEKESDFVTKSGILTKPRGENKTLEGIVTHCGENNGDLVEIKPGDHILYDTDCDFEIIVEGEKYFKQRHDEVLAVLT